jgi:cell division protein FtsL
MKNPYLRHLFLLSLLFSFLKTPAHAQTALQEPQRQIESLSRQVENLNFTLDQLEKAIDDITWYNKVGDIAYLDRAVITGPRPELLRMPQA